jgi:hypothetical protein
VLIKKLEEEILELNAVWKRDLKKTVSDFKFKIGSKQGGDKLFMKIDEISKFELEEVNLGVSGGIGNRWDSRQSDVHSIHNAGGPSKGKDYIETLEDVFLVLGLGNFSMDAKEAYASTKQMTRETTQNDFVSVKTFK